MLPTLLISLVLSFATPATYKLPVTSGVQLASRTFSLDDRYGNTFVNDVFKDNILLTMSYMDGSVKAKGDINWAQVEKPFTYEFTLKPGEEFAFHDQTDPKYAQNVVKTTNAHYNSDEGFKSDGYLVGDGVCHLASFIDWVAKDAGLTVVAPTNHNFAKIADVPKEYGVGIYADPYAKTGGSSNLYITNNKDKPVKFVFEYKNDNLSISVIE